LLSGSSLKAALDLDWDDPTEQERALAIVLGVLGAVEGWLDTHLEGHDTPAVQESLATAQQVKQQDVTNAADGRPVLREASCQGATHQRGGCPNASWAQEPQCACRRV
jgi:hypothetical protein